MVEACIFIAVLAMAAKSCREIKLLVENSYEENVIQQSNFSLLSCSRRKKNQNDEKDC
jgi:hypothetical protein